MIVDSASATQLRTFCIWAVSSAAEDSSHASLMPCASTIGSRHRGRRNPRNSSFMLSGLAHMPLPILTARLVTSSEKRGEGMEELKTCPIRR